MVDATRNETLSYTYDELDRLKTINGPYSQNYYYNSIGNIMDMGFRMTAISAGRVHTCALTFEGGAKCWGSNGSGRLGDNTTIQRTALVSVSGLATGVGAISAGGAHTCALTTGGGVKCWGKNANGQLGDATTTQRKTPVDVSGLTSGVSAISAGGEHTCALTTGGGVKCWGDNTYGQLGDGTNTDRLTPTNVSGLASGVSAISTSENHTCAVLTTGGLKCWGRNLYGQLGDGTTTDRNTPVDVTGLTSGISAVSPGTDHTCALTTTGGLKCWGRNAQGRLGDGTTTQRLTPVDVSGFTSGASAVSAASDHTCALTTGGGVKCWGDNGYGQLGDGTNTDRLTPTNVSGLASGISAISIGGDRSCALTTSGGVKCWGENANGQLGNNSLVNTNLPVNTLFTPLSTYTYGDTAHKHAVTALSTGESYSYDANGNMTARVEGGLTYTQSFDVENRLVSVTVGGQTTQFVYDGDGNLVKKIQPDGSKTLYVGGIYEVDKTSGGSVTRTVTYYPVAGAMRIDSILYYVLKDHLGSASVVTDASGATVGEQRYYPFGETRLTTGTIFTDRLFTGQREMAGLGIYHFNARFYSPNLGRFLSADSIVPGYANPQSLNRFSYVLNNPLRYNDPSGHKYCDAQGEGDCSRYSQSIEHTALKCRIKFKGKGGNGDRQAFIEAVEKEAGRMYDVHCQNQTACTFSGPEGLYAATHGTTVITFSNSSTRGYCERNANSGEEGVICSSNSSGQIDSILAAHELGHVLNALIHNNGHITNDPYHDLANERVNNRKFPAIDVDITPGYSRNSGDTGEDFANMYSMWVFNEWTDTIGGKEREKFMNNNMYTWILKMLDP